MSDSASKSSGGPRVRFAPSPTGYLHVGGARTALFNWLFARRQGGAMILRIEDTDAERNKPELVNGIIEGLRWLGVDWDEGPYHQSERTALYHAAAKKCLANGSAFLCYCPPEKYAGGDHAPESGEATQVRRVVRCSCREGTPSTPGTRPAIRFKVPIGGTTKFFDAVFGEREFSNDEIEDFVLLRSGKTDGEFGQAMYHLSVVVDDIDMRITHVIRMSMSSTTTLRWYMAWPNSPSVLPERRRTKSSISSFENSRSPNTASKNFVVPPIGTLKRIAGRVPGVEGVPSRQLQRTTRRTCVASPLSGA